MVEYVIMNHIHIPVSFQTSESWKYDITFKILFLPNVETMKIWNHIHIDPQDSHHLLIGASEFVGSNLIFHDSVVAESIGHNCRRREIFCDEVVTKST